MQKLINSKVRNVMITLNFQKALSCITFFDTLIFRVSQPVKLISY